MSLDAVAGDFGVHVKMDGAIPLVSVDNGEGGEVVGGGGGVVIDAIL
jgi:hypothetical protein